MNHNRLPTLKYNGDSKLGLKWAIIIFFLSIAYRALCFSVVHEEPLLNYPVVDADYHYHWAQRIVAGDFFGHGPDDVFKPPLYAYFLAGWVFAAGKSIGLIQWVQYVLGALSCLIAAIIGSRFMGQKVGRMVGILSALYAPYAFFESQLLTPALSIFLNLAALQLLVQENIEPPSWHALVSGVLFGLSAGVRPDVLLPAICLNIFLFLLWYYRTGSLGASLSRVVWVSVGLIAMILPITIRNWMITNQFVLVSSNAGINFYTGNSDGSDGISAIPVGLRWERLVSRVPQPVLEQPAQASLWWITQTLKEIKAHPNSTIQRVAKKALALFNGREFRNNICYHFMQERTWPFRFPFIQYKLVLPLAICGLLFLLPKSGPMKQPMLIFVVIWLFGFWVLGVIFFVTARYRIPLVPILMIPAGWTLVQIASAIRNRQWPDLGKYVAVICIVGSLVWPSWFGRPQRDWAKDYVNLGNARISSGDLIGAERAYRQALTIQDDPDAHFLLSRVLLKRRRTQSALRHLESAQMLLPDSPDLLLTSGQAFLMSGQPHQARRTFYRLINLSKKCNLWPKRSEWALSHSLLADLEPRLAAEHWEKAWLIHPPTAAEVSFRQRTNMPRVLQTFRTEAEKKPWDWYAQANYGLVLLETGESEQAAKYLRVASTQAPDKYGLRFQLARALAQSGMQNEAAGILKELLDKLPYDGLRRNVQALYNRLRDR
jgi:tetratricopeptide (TPR) repeat protein